MAIATQAKSNGAESAFWYLLPIGAGLLAMYLPSYFDTGRRFWIRPDEIHAPIILMILLWLLWRERGALTWGANSTERAAGAALFCLGLLLYIVGRSQEFFQFDLGSQIPVLLGLALMLGGKRACMRILFPACFALFLIPIPPSVLDQVLVPLKVTVSQVVTEMLFFLGYPISRTGAVIVIGQYNLLIADACAGLRSMLALSGIGLLYVYLLASRSVARNALLLASAIPIAFIANVARVTLLVLITYHWGDEAGSQFHDAAGFVEIALAFGAFFAIDTLLVRLRIDSVRAAAP